MIWYLIFTAWNPMSGGYVSNIVTVPSARACRLLGEQARRTADAVGASNANYKCVGVRGG